MKAAQAKSKPSSEVNELALILLWQDVLGDLAIQESKAGQLARSILRAEREGRGAEVRHLVEQLGQAIVKAMPKLRKRNPKTGRWVLNLDLPADWLE